jgi:hypothetical protein
VQPLLSNLFIHYTFDLCTALTHQELPWCRFADDGLVHSRNEREARPSRPNFNSPGRVLPGAACDKSQDRLLQGQETQRIVSERPVRLSRILLSAATGWAFPRQQTVPRMAATEARLAQKRELASLGHSQSYREAVDVLVNFARSIECRLQGAAFRDSKSNRSALNLRGVWAFLKSDEWRAPIHLQNFRLNGWHQINDIPSTRP